MKRIEEKEERRTKRKGGKKKKKRSGGGEDDGERKRRKNKGKESWFLVFINNLAGDCSKTNNKLVLSPPLRSSVRP